MILLLALILVAGGLLTLAVTADLGDKAAVLTAAGDAGTGAAMAEARQRWLSLMVGLLAGVVLLVFLLVVRLARRPAESAPFPVPPTEDDPKPKAV